MFPWVLSPLHYLIEDRFSSPAKTRVVMTGLVPTIVDGTQLSEYLEVCGFLVNVSDPKDIGVKTASR